MESPFLTRLFLFRAFQFNLHAVFSGLKIGSKQTKNVHTGVCSNLAKSLFKKDLKVGLLGEFTMKFLCTGNSTVTSDAPHPTAWHSLPARCTSMA